MSKLKLDLQQRKTLQDMLEGTVEGPWLLLYWTRDDMSSVGDGVGHAIVHEVHDYLLKRAREKGVNVQGICIPRAPAPAGSVPSS